MKYHNNDSFASDPGKLELNLIKFQLINDIDLSNKPRIIDIYSEKLKFGDSRAAVVIDESKGLIAAYSDEIDGVALLKFDFQKIKHNIRLIKGHRLLTVNTYQIKSVQCNLAEDLIEGPNNLGQYCNFLPLIADFISDDFEKMDKRKSEISEAEWSLALNLGLQAVKNGIKPRDGRPLYAFNVSQKKWWKFW